MLVRVKVQKKTY